VTGLSDSFQRPINYLRISVTDRCNLRCMYCMPAEGIKLMPHQDILSYEEICVIVRAAAELGITKVRITGGEPLVRLGLPALIKMIEGINAIDDISLTTNGVLLGRYARELKEAGLRRVNVSLDTLKEERFKPISRSSYSLSDVLGGIEAAGAVGLTPVKLNMVVMAGVNDDELVSFAQKTISNGWHVRFIELMPFEGAGTIASQFISVSEMRKRLEVLGELEPSTSEVGNGPAKYFRFPGAEGTIGFITPVSEHFCFKCNRLRLTADGKLRPCLMSDDEIDLRGPLRSGISCEGLKHLIETAASRKPLRHHIKEGCKVKAGTITQVGG